MTLVSTCQPPSNDTLSNSLTPSLDSYFEGIKSDAKALRNFFWQMPKGGDIHHHALGSVQAEDYLQIAIVKGLWIDPSTYQLYFDNHDAAIKGSNNALPVSELLESQPEAREEIIDHWSVRNHLEKGRNGHHWFFSTFEKFEAAMIGNEPWFLSRICQAAARENIQYLETMVAVPSILQRVSGLIKGKQWEPGISIKDHLQEWFEYLESQNMNHWAQYNAEVLDHWINSTNTYGVTLKFQTVGLRILPDMAMTFSHLVLAFKTALLTDNLVGVNFVAPEDHTVSLNNYKTHMAMFRFLKSRYPQVNLSLHAGELVLGKGDAQPEDLQFHIDHAITVAGAQRIGHGVDIMHETDKEQLLSLMKEKGIAVEINLESNRVILETTPEDHPFKMYLDSGVPLCISSDDAAILRSDLTHQFEMAVSYKPDISYQQIKEIVFNSIRYSFLNAEDKELALERLSGAFKSFEVNVLTSATLSMQKTGT